MFITIQSNVKDKILATLSETSKVENAPAEMLRDLDQKMEKRADDVRGMVLEAQSEAFKQENVLAERLHGLDQQMERKEDESLYFMDRIYVPLVGSKMDEAHASRSPIIWAEIEESSLTGPEWFKKRLIKCIGPVAYRLRLYGGMSGGTWDTFPCVKPIRILADASLHVPLDEIKVDKTLHFVEELVEIMDREVKSLKRSRILPCESSLEFKAWSRVHLGARRPYEV
ncbi:hypothetical protein Tco_1082599 [Tanacetum coccineum]|uniref:Reverse transcriptase domain-containing protein n=1 Tax=Tanacetum coccineum TaxID=301880 RepID=A0ABQ5I1Q8_9ASTR